MSKSLERRAHLYQWLRLWWQTFLRETSAPLIDTSARLQFLSLIALLIYVLPAAGTGPLEEGVTNAWRATRALLYALPIFVVLNAVLAVVKAKRVRDDLGVWIGNRFVFHKPQHLFTTVVTDANNNIPIPFKIPGLPRHAGIELIVEVEKGFDDRHIKVQLIHREDGHIYWDEYERRSVLTSVPEDETYFVVSLKPTPSNASTVKVFLMSWYVPQR